MAQEGGVVMDRRFVPAGAVIVHQGQEGTAAFLVQSGKVRVYVTDQDSGVVTELSRLGPGQFFGEMALIVEGPRSATVEAVEDCNLVVISRPALMEKLERSDPTIRALVPMLMKRLAKANEGMSGRQNSFSALAHSIEEIYENKARSLSTAQKMTLDETVRPHLEAFLNALKNFQV